MLRYPAVGGTFENRITVPADYAPDARLPLRVQLHGGMGVTEEMEIIHHFRRLTAATLRYGSTSDYLTRFADLKLT